MYRKLIGQGGDGLPPQTTGTWKTAQKGVIRASKSMQSYTIQEWIEDFAFAVGLTVDPAATPTYVKEKEREYFYSKYQGIEAIDHFARFLKAMQFLDQHFDDLSFGRACVAGEKANLVGQPLVRALHEYFTSIKPEQIDESPTVEHIKHLAIKHGA